MSRLSQLYWLLNEEKMPTKIEQEHHYTSLSIDDQVKKIRREHLAIIRKADKESK